MFLYLAGLGALVFFLEKGRIHGLLSIVFAAGYLLFNIRWLLPFLGSDIMSSSMTNYIELGTSFGEVVSELFRRPWLVFPTLFDEPEKCILQLQSFLNT